MTVRCLPEEVPKSIDVDVTKMEAGEVLTIGNIQLPEGGSRTDPEQIVVTLTE